ARPATPTAPLQVQRRPRPGGAPALGRAGGWGSLTAPPAAGPPSNSITQSFREAQVMNWDLVKGDWEQFTGQGKEKLGKLTDDDLTAIAGKRDQLAGKLQQRYGYAKDQAERELDDFVRTLHQP